MRIEDNELLMEIEHVNAMRRDIPDAEVSECRRLDQIGNAEIFVSRPEYHALCAALGIDWPAAKIDAELDDLAERLEATRDEAEKGLRTLAGKMVYRQQWELGPWEPCPKLGGSVMCRRWSNGRHAAQAGVYRPGYAWWRTAKPESDEVDHVSEKEKDQLSAQSAADAWLAKLCGGAK